MARDVSRRHVLRTGALTGLGIVVAGNIDAIAGPVAAHGPEAGYGPLVPDPAGLLALPERFSYKVVARAGVTTLESGEPTPSDADGTACFLRDGGGFVLVNNHEIGGTEPFGVPASPGLVFDPGARGGTTTIEVDRDGNRIREYVSLAGTHNNCAGGMTPWGTWLTCEETEQRAGGVFRYDHGWVFEVDAHDQQANHDPVPLKFLGRFAHEAVAVNPHTGDIMLTEDASGPNGLYYRWTPPRDYSGGKGALRALALGPSGETVGRLRAMSAYDGRAHVPDLALATRPGTRYRVRWIDVPDRLADSVPVRTQFTNDRVTRSRKLEGAWWADGGAYFVASFARRSDGSAREHDGQVWRYDPRHETIELKTIFGVNRDPGVEGTFDGPDNITVSPHGGIILAEDGAGLSHLVGVTARGRPYALARNEISPGEFAGPTYSPDGRILFANIQNPGLVFAITGPWRRPRS